MSLRLIQISDCHLGPEPGSLYRGLPALQSLQSLLPAIEAFCPELIVASGDISEDGSPASYALFRQALATRGVPVLCLPGNHDHPQTMAEVMTDTPVKVCSHYGTGAWRLHLLDSTIAGDPSGRISEQQLNRVVNEIEHQQEAHALLFLHHQPLPVESPWIDKYRLKDGQDFRRTIKGLDKVRAVAWGHIHHPWRRLVGDQLWLGCPSTVANAVAFTDEFSLDSGGPACRWFRLHDDGRLDSGVLSRI